MIEAIVGLVSGVVSGMGIGGGSILILYLTLFAGMAQQQAQGINLLYFLPTAASALVVHVKIKAIDYKLALVCALSGILTAALTSLLAVNMDGELLKKLFAIFILLLGLRELFSKKAAEPKDCAEK